jgi:MerR family transcriptional regulator, copper efflux regulator
MNIGEAADFVGLPSKTLRYYETIGLVIPARHPGNDYRFYSRQDLDQLILLRRARAAGYGLDDCRLLLQRFRQPEMLVASLKPLLLEQVAYLEAQQAELAALQVTLAAMASQCHSASSDPQFTSTMDKPAANVMTFRLLESDSE